MGDPLVAEGRTTRVVNKQAENNMTRFVVFVSGQRKGRKGYCQPRIDLLYASQPRRPNSSRMPRVQCVNMPENPISITGNDR